MTAKQLIVKLQNLDPDTKICICVGDSPGWAETVELGAYDGDIDMYRYNPTIKEIELENPDLQRCICIE